MDKHHAATQGRKEQEEAATHRQTNNTLGNHIQNTRNRKIAAAHRTREKHEAATHGKQPKQGVCLSVSQPFRMS